MEGKLTAAAVERAGVGMHFDGGGLYLQVTGPGAKSWIYRYSIHGQARWMGLGSARDLSLSKARQKRDKVRAAVRVDGIDPVAEQKRERAAQRAADHRIIFRRSAATFIAAQESGGAWSNRKHALQWGSTLRRYVYPLIGYLPVQEISRSHIIAVLEPIWTTKPETARRVLGRVEAIIDWAIARGDRIDENNPARGGALLKGLAKQSKAVKPHAALPYAEIGEFMATLRGRDGTAARALEFAILTGARTGEVLGARWSEVDLRAHDLDDPERTHEGRPRAPRAIGHGRGRCAARHGEGP